MAKAANEPTRAPAAAQSAPAPNEEVLAIAARRERSELTPWDIACQIEKPTHALSDYVDMLAIISCDDDLQREIASAISRLVQDMRPCLTKIEELRSRLFFDLHPRRHEPGFPPGNLDDGNGEVEEAAGDAA